MNKEAKIFVAGHRGMVGSAIVRKLLQAGYSNVVTRTHGELGLTNQSAVAAFFSHEKLDYVFLAAAKVGGVHANNTYRGEFIYQNLMMEANVVHAAMEAGVQRMLFWGPVAFTRVIARNPSRKSIC
jgi:GDP-L-fucose synthase